MTDRRAQPDPGRGVDRCERHAVVGDDRAGRGRRQAGSGDCRRRREGGRGDRAHRPDHRNGDRGQRRGRLDGERGRVHGQRRGPELLERVVLDVELADRQAEARPRRPVSSRSTRCTSWWSWPGSPRRTPQISSVGQPATLTFPALTNTEVAGKVVAVSNSSTVVNNVVTYDATIALVNPPADVKQGMTTNVSVVTATRASVLVLPTAAITTNGSISTVQLLQNGETTVTRVTTGLVGNSTTEIVSGLRAGDVVVEPTVTITASSSSSTTGGGPFGGGGGGFPGGGAGFPGG